MNINSSYPYSLVNDREHTPTYLAETLKLFGLKNKEITQLKNALMQKEFRMGEGGRRLFSDEDLYNCLLQSEYAARFCERHKLGSWQEIIAYRIWREDEDFERSQTAVRSNG